MSGWGELNHAALRRRITALGGVQARAALAIIADTHPAVVADALDRAERRP